MTDTENKLAYSVEETADMLSVGRDSIYELIRTGQLATFKIGKRRLVALADIEAFIDKAKVCA
ncbi:MAG: helix-turn-helix domain-containing protein [Actinomycetota bacterium]